MKAALAIVAACAVAGCMRTSSADLATIPSRAGSANTATQGPAAPPAQTKRTVPPPEAFSDPAITANIRAAIRGDPAMAGSDISVNTTQGVVELTGKVASQEQIAIASGYAQRQDGVVRVDDHLSLPLK